MHLKKPSLLFIAFHLAGASLFWGSMFVIIRWTGGEIHYVTLAAWRGIFAALALALVARLFGQSPLPSREELKPWAVLGFINGLLPNLLIAYAMLSLPAGAGALLVAAAPLFTALLAHALLEGVQHTARRSAGIALGLSGVALLAGGKALEGAGLLPSLAVVATALLYAIGNIYIRGLKHLQGGRLALGQQAFSAIFGCLAAFALLGPAGLYVQPGQFPALILLGVLATAIPTVLFMRLIQAAGPVTASLTGYLIPLSTVGLAALFLGEQPNLRQAAAGAVIMAGIYLAAPARKAAAG